MPDDFPSRERIVFDAKPAVMNHKRHAGRAYTVGNDARMKLAVLHVPADDIARLPCFESTPAHAQGQSLPETGKKFHLIRDAAMVNIFVWSGQAPLLRVQAKFFLHVFVHQLLQIVVRTAQGTHNDNRGNSFQCSHRNCT